MKDELYFTVSLGWTANASGKRQKAVFESLFKEAGVARYDFADANYDAKKQSVQIEEFIAKKPDALFITPSDPAGIATAVKQANIFGIPVFSSDGLIPGAEAVSTVMFDNYASGCFTMRHLGDLLLKKYPSGDIGIGMITLPMNEGWDAREHGARFILSQKKYERIKVKYEWPWDPTGTVTTATTVESWLGADTRKELKAIWCAWDGAVFDGLAVTAAYRPDIIYTGSDGGEDAYNKMLQYPDQFVMTVGESVFAMPSQLTNYALAWLKKKRVPRLVMVPGYAITAGMVLDVHSIKNKTETVCGGIRTAWQLMLDYDLPDYTDALNTVLSANGLEPAWVPEI
ncbi:MAG: sugar ABC transporter substrate-binding protein [Treponema sp.]|jgi:ribose transport system substrate-binding protein|nr:sugar ABC transporter substrate-binding protein [Treponema sp.]